MAINITRKSKEELSVEMSNGHLETLDKIVKDYGLSSEKEALAFLLSVISQADGTPIEVSGTKYLPSDSLKTPKS